MGNRPKVPTLYGVAEKVRKTGEWTEVTGLLPVGMNVTTTALNTSVAMIVCRESDGELRLALSGKVGKVRVFIAPIK